MSNPSWLNLMQQTLQQIPPSEYELRVVVLGIGNEFNGDDAAGLLIARQLAARLAMPERLHVIEAGTAPENYTGAIRAFAPQLVLLVDAAQMGEMPGMVRWLAWQDTTGISASSHTLPLHMLGRFLVSEIGCQVGLLGIQPATNAFDAPLSSVVDDSITQVVDHLTAFFANVFN